MGSPPLTRERHRNMIVNDAEIRITPAYAGKTLSTQIGLKPTRDHPRLRGKDHFRVNQRD